MLCSFYWCYPTADNRLPIPTYYCQSIEKALLFHHYKEIMQDFTVTIIHTTNLMVHEPWTQENILPVEQFSLFSSFFHLVCHSERHVAPCFCMAKHASSKMIIFKQSEVFHRPGWSGLKKSCALMHASSLCFSDGANRIFGYWSRNLIMINAHICVSIGIEQFDKNFKIIEKN